jgi:hypothetical protein
MASLEYEPALTARKEGPKALIDQPEHHPG